MLELPEAAVIAAQINQTVVGKQIMHVVANHSPHKFAWYTGDPAEYHYKLCGKTIRKAMAYAGEVEISVDDMILLIGTALKYHTQGEKLPEKHQLLLEFNDNTRLSASIQMWGGLFCFKEGEPAGFEDYNLGKKLPSPLTDAFDRAYFDGLFNESTGKLSAKAFLATEQRIPGLGNGVLQDILWSARIHPKRKMAGLKSGEIQEMYTSVRSVLRLMVQQGGRDTERDLFGNPGGYKTVLSKNTANTPCPSCGTSIKKEAYLGGSIYFCEICQSLGS